MVRRSLVVCSLAAALAAAPAAAQDAPSVTAIGSAQVAVTPRNRMDDASIRYAVKAASVRAIPLAIADAGARASHLASAAGLLLGPIVSVSENAQAGVPYAPFPPFPLVTPGPVASVVFGQGGYCGTVTRPVLGRGASGRRQVIRRVRERRCSVPPFASVTLTVTFSAALPPPPTPCLAGCTHG